MPIHAMAGRPNFTARKRLPPTTRVSGISLLPPINGWNARDSLANMKDGDAIELTNWFPRETTVKLRNGFASHATGMSTTIESLMTWAGPSSSKLFAVASGASIFDVTSAGAVGAAAVSGLTNSRFQHVMFTISSGAYLYCVNGADAPRYFDGTSWTTPSLSGVGLTTTDLIHINVFKKRLFFVENNSMSVWYLDVESVAGTLTEFSLGSQASRGGYLVAMGTWTRAGAFGGFYEYAVFITSEGQAIVYQGTDPSTADADAWSLVGTFNIGVPVGRRCFLKLGADLIVVTTAGFGMMSSLLAADEASTRALMSDRISGAVKDAMDLYKGNFGWQPVFYPGGKMILFNVPHGTTSEQFVSNSTTGAWCRFTDMDAFCWEICEDQLYFGAAGGIVYQADTGTADDGADINTTARSAFSYFGDRTKQKRFSMARPLLTVDGDITLATIVNVDFDNVFPTSTPSFTPFGGAAWDAATWDVDEWGDAGTISKDWIAVEGIGSCASIAIKTSSMNGNIEWAATEWKLEPVSTSGYV